MGHLVKVGALTCWLAACGPSESRFVVEYTDAYCAWYLDCGDSAQLVFDGVDTLEECRAIVGPDIADEADGCKLDRAPARACLDAMATLACPTDPEAELDDALPAECATTWKKCLGQIEGDTG